MDPVTRNELELKKWKEKTRREALESEVERLKSLTAHQSEKIKKVTIALISTLALLVLSLIGVFILQNSEKKNQANIKTPAAKEEIATQNAIPPVPKGLNIISPASDTIKLNLNENGILFSVQIGAYSGQNLDEYKDNMLSLHQYKSENINQFTLGLFTGYEKALAFKEAIKKIGIKDSYITAIRDGRRIKIEEALSEKETP
ncbi:hypothetical protein BY457_10164 [Marinilabilia salmonicolor]|jgi:hypothetical protein|uniref:hypothetical protein n=1 Tax=Marinilabilia salmonicolor TaxID=989 RepID=UPI000D055E54|nr:hypothetical protein [Marinilabilia salmonicolor]PRZ02043.1 hypothetical protein BY457_10164 [Marinilabilia salmonicolor]